MAFFTGGGGGLPDIGVPYANISPTTIPDFKNLMDMVVNSIPSSFPTLQGTLDQGVESPYVQSILSGITAPLQTQQDVAREGLTDRFRAAGGLAGGAHGVAAGRLEEGIYNQNIGLMAQVMQAMLPALVQGMGQEVQAGMAGPSLLQQVLQSIRPQMVVGKGGSAGGLMGGGGSPSSFPSAEQAIAQASQAWDNMWDTPVAVSGAGNPQPGLDDWYLPGGGGQSSLTDMAGLGGGPSVWDEGVWDY